jgi:hypothetical protein
LYCLNGLQCPVLIISAKAIMSKLNAVKANMKFVELAFAEDAYSAIPISESILPN